MAVERASIDGVEIEYEMVGQGEPVVMIHGALIGDAFRPLLAEPSLADGYRLIHYHRSGYVGSGPAREPDNMERLAGECQGLLAHLGVRRAHVMGHSSGGAIALQLALDRPEIVHSLVLLEPALMVGASGEAYRAALARGGERFRTVETATLVDEFLQSRWPGYETHLDGALPGAFAQAVADARTTFESELPALLAWRFGKEEVQQVTQPVLSVLGGESEALWPRFGETHCLLLEWLPQGEGSIVPGATHLMQVEQPGTVAEAVTGFLRRHPMGR
jgi:pimeloyl-ACP methyl ester carboxylesterase